MARGVNKVILIGNLGRDPEVRYMPSGDAMATINVATTESWRDRNSGQQQDHTEWHRVALFRRLAEIAGEYLHKGSQVYIEGKLRTRKWTDQSGQERYTTEIIADSMQFLGGRNESAGGQNHQHMSQPTQGSNAPQQENHFQQMASSPATQNNSGNDFSLNEPPKQPGSTQSSPQFETFDDEIPF